MTMVVGDGLPTVFVPAREAAGRFRRERLQPRREWGRRMCGETGG